MVARAKANKKRAVYPKLWRVRVDGLHAGFMPWRPGSKLLMHLRHFSPEEMRFIESEVERQVAELTGNPPFKVDSVVPREPPVIETPEDSFDDLDL